MIGISLISKYNLNKEKNWGGFMNRGKEVKIINFKWLRFKKKLKNFFSFFVPLKNCDKAKQKNSQRIHKVI